MPMTLRRRLATAWIALAAMLFGAISPAIAGVLFAGQADVLGRMLAIPASAQHAAPAPDAADDDGCPHESAGGDGHHQPSNTGNGGHSSDPHDDTRHAAHGVFCSFCLAAGATVTLPTAAPPVLGVAAADLPSSSGHERESVRPQLSGHPSRAPPAFL